MGQHLPLPLGSHRNAPARVPAGLRKSKALALYRANLYALMIAGDPWIYVLRTIAERRGRVRSRARLVTGRRV